MPLEGEVCMHVILEIALPRTIYIYIVEVTPVCDRVSSLVDCTECCRLCIEFLQQLTLRTHQR